MRDGEGAPSGEKKLEKWGAMLGSEEAIKGWNELSEPALEKFMKDNFDKSWGKFDMYNRGSIDLGEANYFIRDLMMSLAPPEAEEKNPYDVPDVATIKAQPTVTTDSPTVVKNALSNPTIVSKPDASKSADKKEETSSISEE